MSANTINKSIILNGNLFESNQLAKLMTTRWNISRKDIKIDRQ